MNPVERKKFFLQLIGLDRLITRVTWEIMNVQVVQEVITILNINTMETTLNGQNISVFSKDGGRK